jgi:hypothetical protein
METSASCPIVPAAPFVRRHRDEHEHPAFHVSDASEVKGRGEVFIASRASAPASGVFSLDVTAKFAPPADDYPLGGFTLRVDLNDGLRTTFTPTSIELMNSFGRANPTVFLTGRCKAEQAAGAEASKGLCYWLMVVDNGAAIDDKATPDVVGFAIHDNTGARIAYGTGPVKKPGDFKVKPKP